VLPVFSAHRYGEGTGWNNKAKKHDNSFPVTFENHHTSTLDLHWIGPTEKVFQGSLAPGAEMEMTTYVGHRFGWSEQGQTEYVPRGVFEIELGSREYRYGGKEEPVPQLRTNKNVRKNRRRA
jgi:hypothetical protein